MPGAPVDIPAISGPIHTLPSSNLAGTSDTVALPVQGVTGGVPVPVSITSGGTGGGAVTAVSGAFVDGAITTIGTEADTAWGGSGSSTVIAALKAIYAKVAGTLTATISGAVSVTGTFWQATQPISAASLPLPAGAATSANQPTAAAQGSATAAQTGILAEAAVTTAAPTYTTAQTSPLSLTLAGGLRVDGSGVTQPISAAALPLPTGAMQQTGGSVAIAGTAAISAVSLPLPAGAAQDGADATGVTQFTGGVGIRGWLSGIFSKLSNALAVTQSGTWTVQPGNTANTTAWKVDGSAVTQPVSTASLPLPAGASTAAKQPALGTAGAASADVLSVQGVASMTALKIDGSGVTQPVSGTVTANAGTNLNTSALALAANQTLPYTPVTPAAATATKGLLLGGQYNGTSLPSFTSGQQGFIPVDQNGALNSGFDGQQFSPASVTSAATIFTQDMTGYQSITVHVTSPGTSCTLQYETSEDNINWLSATGYNSNVGTGSSAVSISTTAILMIFPKKGRYFRARVSIYGSGTVAVIYSLHKATAVLTTGSIAVQGPSASGTTVGGLPVVVGFDARTSNLSVANGQGVYGVSTLAGAQIVYPWSIPELTWQFAAASGGIVNTTTAVTLKAAGAAGIINYLKGLDISTDVLGTATQLAIRDGAAGTVIWRGKLQTTSLPLTNIVFAPPLRGSAATLMEAVTLTASGTGGVYINAQGFQGP